MAEMSNKENIPGTDIPRSVFLSRNWGGDHYVVTVRPPVGLDVLRELGDGLKEFTGLGWWGIYLSEKEARLTRHNDLGGDDGLKKAGKFVCDQLDQMGYWANLPNAAIYALPRTENGFYEEAA